MYKSSRGSSRKRAGGACALAVLAVSACAVPEDEGEPIAPLFAEGSGCDLGAPGVYSPYAFAVDSPIGTVSQWPWRGPFSEYPGGVEDFRDYDPLSTTVECSHDKGAESHLDVTSGCLQAVAVSGGRYDRGRVQLDSKNHFRAVALGYPRGDASDPLRWTDQAIEFRFYHHGRTAEASYPGFKAFVRYSSENDLYVANWRMDGVVQIKRKLCGEYVTLAVDKTFGAPDSWRWNWMRFEADGPELSLYLNGDLVLRAWDPHLAWGTAGIRVDSVDGAYLDDWAVYEP